MRRIRLSFAALLVWLSVFFNVERLFEPINLASFVYIVAAALSIIIIMLPGICLVARPWVFLFPIPLVIALKVGFGYGITGVHLPLTVTEICALEITVALSLWISRGLAELHEALLAALLEHVEDKSSGFTDGQRQMYREIRRARIYDRPLALLALSATATEQSVSRCLKELLRELAQRYTQARLVELISSHTKPCDIIAQRNGHFLVLLPEVDRQKAQQLVVELQAAADDSLGLGLKAGLAVFPEDEVTFVKLLDRAETAMSKTAEITEPHQAVVIAGTGHL